MKTITLFITLLMGLMTARGAQHHVSPQGSSTGKGSATSPWSLSTAMAHPPSVRAGDTIYLHGGRYVGQFTSELWGSSSQPIVVMGAPGETAIIDGNNGVSAEAALIINGQHVVYRDFHVANSHKGRIQGGSPAVVICSGISVFGANNRLTGLMVYDNPGNGIGFWSSATESVIEGCLIFHNGYQGMDRGHGHGIYTQNATGTKTIRDNIIFNGFQYGIHAYTEGGSIKGYRIDGNVLFNNGILQRNGTLKPNILIGGLQPADRIALSNNLLFQSSSLSNNLELGYSVVNQTAEIKGNTILNGSIAVMVNKWKNVTFTGNRVVGPKMLLGIDSQGVDYTVYQWNNNNYHGAGTTPFSQMTWDGWRSLTGFDAQSSWQTTYPTTNDVWVRPIASIPGRAHIIVINWQKLGQVNVNVASVLTPGTQYEVVDAQNPMASPLLKGTWNGGPLTLTTNQTIVQAPNGTVPNQPVHTPVEVCIYVLKTIGTPLPKPEPEPEPTDTTYVNAITDYYPNPTPDFVVIEYDYVQEVTLDVLVANETGMVVHREQHPTTKGKNKLVLNLSHLPNGLYVVRLGEGSSSLTCKVVKQPFVIKTNRTIVPRDSVSRSL
ncbi:putative secreted protein (Por secretion system target) [Breznakibacter xylanolyticus]|uniref:Putative secreted protein (Por secretion system target) n=1 Tax=Breznakibacter xylanolyticus TaxID=990 RepID=A0A2W7MZH8_9BACT|nr:right-handed parallel beta-helix repeat-containing protein [Breznakibacter xylanolyticus]PZX13545.1 putative secreted protein (Por secretion system target) [Breznakibacter xylanolyticus]